MFQDQKLQDHLETSSSIRSQSAVLAEWNMNLATNIKQIGNYRYRPTDTSSVFQNIASSFELEDGTSGTANFYYGATDADVIVDGGTDTYDPSTTFGLRWRAQWVATIDYAVNDAVSYNGLNWVCQKDAPIGAIPGNDSEYWESTTFAVAFKTKKEKEKMLYSLEDCFGRHRPRSGINKLRYFANKYTNVSGPDMARRPRYYMADKKDAFKYWSSYRTEDGIERGIAKIIKNNNFYIDDAAPFVVYEKAVPANRVVIKMQTNVGDLDKGTFHSLNSQDETSTSGSFPDPFFGDDKKTTPVKWKIQSLQDQNWIDIISFNENSIRRDGTAIINSDGYLEIGYGLIVPEEYRESFYYVEEHGAVDMLPDPTSARDGLAYFIKNVDSQTKQEYPGTYYITQNGQYESFVASYGWYVNEEEVSKLTNFARDLTSPPMFINANTGRPQYREFEYLSGLRVVIETMNAFDSTFDLIELSPRLIADLSDKVKSFSVTKTASDLGTSGMPVGQLLASTGTLEIFDYDQAFFQENSAVVQSDGSVVGSIVADYTAQNVQIKFFDVIVDLDGYDYYVPMKTLYAEGFPEVSSTDRKVSLNLRDLFYYFESMVAPQVMIQDVSLSYAIALLLDNIGFSNYVFKRNESEDEMIIPYFTVEPDRSIAEILSDLAVSAQASMFFDEYNNFIVMSKNYIMPTKDERATDLILYGTTDFEDTGINENEYSNDLAIASTGKKKLANIIELSAQTNNIFNDGQINYSTKYIQRSVGSIKQASMIDQDRVWLYKPALLWEVSPSSTTKSVNDEISQQSEYVLSAIPLNSDLKDSLPTVVNHQLVNNIIDLGEGIYWLGRYNGYLYANGEIIRFDAVQYSVSGLTDAEIVNSNADGYSVWITSLQEYQRYFAKVPFNGKIYPTGLVRIYSEPNYETVNGLTRLKNGAVAKHGRIQFGTGQRNSDGTYSPIYHNAGLSPYWSSIDNLGGVDMDTKYLFDQNMDKEFANPYNETIVRGVATISDTTPLLSVTTFTGGTGKDTVATTKNHGLSAGNIIYFVTNGTLPIGIEENYKYYVKSVIDNDKFTLSLTLNGSVLQLDDEDLAVQEKKHQWSTVIQSGSFAVTVDISENENDEAVFTKNNHGLVNNQPVYLTSTGSLPGGLLEDKMYKVSFVVSANTFKLKEISGEQIITVGPQSGTHTLYVTNYPAQVSCQGHRFIAGDIVKFSVSSGGSLPSGMSAGTSYYVSSTGLTNNKFLFYSGYTGIGTISIGASATISLANHGLKNKDRVRFTTSGSLPVGINLNQEYYVVQAETNTFKISLSVDGAAISTSGSQSGIHFVYSPRKTDTLKYVGNEQSGTFTISSKYSVDEAKAMLVLADVTGIAPGFTVEKISGNGILQPDTVVTYVDIDHNTIGIFPAVIEPFVRNTVNPSTGEPVINTVRIVDKVPTVLGAAGIDSNKEKAKTTTRNGVIKNFLTKSYNEETPVEKMLSTQTGTIQSSALVMQGYGTTSNDNTPSFVSYVYKKLEDRFQHFGTRLRIIGRLGSTETRGQNPDGSKTYYTSTSSRSDKETTIAGAGGGLAILLNPETNNGYFFEVTALTDADTTSYKNQGIHNLTFYKTKRRASATTDTEKAIPIKLWGGSANIIVDNGNFTGQSRVTSEENTTVYDVSVEYQKIGNTLRFFLYLNGILVATVDDKDPLPITTNVALFTRDSARLMFENIYALTDNYSQNTTFSLGTITESVFSDQDINASAAFQKYAMSGFIQSTFLSGIGTTEPPKYKIYFEEFGTIMREAAYFNIRYDKAYPALYATLSPTANKVKGYAVSGFTASSYGAEFLVFNATDTALSLDSASGNYLRIQGVTFTQQSTHELRVDDYFLKLSDTSNPQFSGESIITSPLQVKEDFFEIKTSRITHGRRDFSLSTSYIQTQDDAEDMMAWMVSKVMKPRRSVGLKLFSMPILQLGDIVEVSYKNSEGINEVAPEGTRFVVYTIEYSKAEDGPEMLVYLSEVK